MFVWTLNTGDVEGADLVLGGCGLDSLDNPEHLWIVMLITKKERAGGAMYF